MVSGKGPTMYIAILSKGCTAVSVITIGTFVGFRFVFIN